MRRFLPILVGLICLGPAVTRAQQSAFVQYNTGDGLAQSQVRAIEWDNHGYLWFGTLGGLSRFDGYDFHNFTEEDGLPDNQINALYSGSKMWIGTTGAIAYHDGTGVRAIPFPERFKASKITDLLETPNGPLWIALAGDGLLRYSKGEFLTYGLPEGLPDAYVRSLAIDARGRLWIGTRSGVVVADKGMVMPPPSPELEGISVSDINRASDDRMIVCTFGHGVFFVSPGHVTRLNTDNGLSTNDVRCVEETGSGELWFGSRTGLTRLANDGLTLFDEDKGMPYSNVKTLATDREGNLWIGTDGQGVLRRTGRPFTYYTTDDGLLSNPVMDICEADTGGLIFATYDRGISLYGPEGFAAYPHNDSLPSSTVWQVEMTPLGALCAATSRGLFIENHGHIRVLDASDGLPGDRVTALLAVGGHTWVGAEGGVAELDADGNILQVFDRASGFDGHRIRYLLRTDKELWIAAEGGVYRYAGQTMERLPEFLEPETAVYALVQDPRGTLWIGTSDGLYIYRSTDERPFEVHFSDNPSGQNVNWLTVWHKQTLMIGTNNGLYRLDIPKFYDRPDQVKVKHYAKYEGLVSSETNQNAVLTRRNDIWFGTTMGAVRFDPSAEAAEKRTAPVLNISSLQLFLEDVDWSSRSDSISPLSGLPVDPILGPGDNYLSFNYAGIYFSNPRKVRYRYMLEGADPHWLGPTSSRTATYAYLPHGDYIFRVQAFQIDDPELVSEQAFAFSITPPFYLTPWFFVLAFVLLVALLYALYRNRVSKERKKQAALRLELHSRLMQLETRSLNSSMNRHFIFNALNSIQYYINMQDRKSANRYLTNFARLIRKNLDSSQRMQTSLKEELERLELYLSLEKMRFQGRFDYSIEVGTGINPEQVNIPAMVLQPFLENSIWHGILPSDKPGTVSVKVQETAEAYTVVIEDDGIGIDNSREGKKADNGYTDDHVSHGVNITINRLRLYENMTGRAYSIDGPSDRMASEGRSGTKVVLHLPKSGENGFPP